MYKKHFYNQRGIIILQTLVFASILVLIIGALSNWTATALKAGRVAYNREQAFAASEAGIDYYRWHLSHAPTDYKDGTNLNGPYVHTLKDKNGVTTGQFSLEITPPKQGYTFVQIKSTGASSLDSSYTRKIVSRVTKPSITRFAVAGNSALRFGAGTEIFGPVHSNGGIRFDGIAHNLVTSGVATYTDTDSDRCTSNSYGVHTCISPKDPSPNGTLSLHSDVFAAGRLTSQPLIDFGGFTSDMNILKTDAKTNGFYRDTAGGTYLGYHIVLKTNDTFDLYKINTWASSGSCKDNTGNAAISYSIGTQTLQGNYAFPINGIIFIEDNVVVDGKINSARLTITAADLPVPSDPRNYKNIYINSDLSYTNYDGTDSLGLIGQGDIKVGLISDTDLKIDGALIAQNGVVGRPYYSGTCATKSRNSITLYGMIASYGRYGFAYTDGTGYSTRDITYDATLMYAPPPSFPITSSQYQTLSWQEVN